MRRSSAELRGLSSALALILLVGACTTSDPKRRDQDAEDAPPKPAIVRPVVVASQGSEELVKAVGFMMVGNYAQAEANLEEIIRVRPDLPEAYFNLALARQKLGSHARVVDAALPGLALRPTESRAWLVLALSERELGQFAAAAASYHAGLALAPNDSRLHLNAGILYDLYLLKPAEALIHYRRYQDLQATPDAKVAGWIAALERKVARDAEAAKATDQGNGAAAGEPERLPELPPVAPAGNPEPAVAQRKPRGKGGK